MHLNNCKTGDLKPRDLKPGDLTSYDAAHLDALTAEECAALMPWDERTRQIIAAMAAEMGVEASLELHRRCEPYAALPPAVQRAYDRAVRHVAETCRLTSYQPEVPSLQAAVDELAKAHGCAKAHGRAGTRVHVTQKVVLHSRADAAHLVVATGQHIYLGPESSQLWKIPLHLISILPGQHRIRASQIVPRAADDLFPITLFVVTIRIPGVNAPLGAA